MAAITPSLVPALFGQAFAEAANSAALLVAAQAFGAVSSVTSALLFATERNRFLVQSGAVSAVAVIAAGLLIIPTYGLMGAVLSRSVIQFATVAACFIFVGRSLACPAPYGSVLRIIAAAAGCAIVARAIVLYAPGLPGVAVAIVAGALVYFGLARLLRALPDEDIVRLQEVAGKMPSWLTPLVSPLVQFFER